MIPNQILAKCIFVLFKSNIENDVDHLLKIIKNYTKLIRGAHDSFDHSVTLHRKTLIRNIRQ